jgi:nicotinamidase-related amidase
MKRHVLVVIDCQNDFITGALRNEEAIKKVPNIVDKINERKWDFIFLTRDTHGEDYMNTPEGKKLPVPHCLKGTDGWKIEESVMEAVVDSKIPYAVYDKYTFGLHSIADDLEYELGEKTEVDFEDDKMYVEFVGFCTDICVVSNVTILKANWYDWADIAVDSNCCAGVTPESHDAALTTMKMCQIDVK